MLPSQVNKNVGYRKCRTKWGDPLAIIFRNHPKTGAVDSDLSLVWGNFSKTHDSS